MHACVCACVCACVGQRTTCGVHSRLIPRRSWGLNSGREAWQKAPSLLSHLAAQIACSPFLWPLSCILFPGEKWTNIYSLQIRDSRLKQQCCSCPAWWPSEMTVFVGTWAVSKIWHCKVTLQHGKDLVTTASLESHAQPTSHLGRRSGDPALCIAASQTWLPPSASRYTSVALEELCEGPLWSCWPCGRILTVPFLQMQNFRC